MTPPLPPIARSFVRAHPEHRHGVTPAVEDGRESCRFDPAALSAFIRWAVASGRVQVIDERGAGRLFANHKITDGPQPVA